MIKVKAFIKRLLPYYYERLKFDLKLSIISIVSFFLIVISLFSDIEIFFAVLTFITIFIFFRLENINKNIKDTKYEIECTIKEMENQKRIIDEHIKEGGLISLDDRRFLDTFDLDLDYLKNELNSLPKTELL